jgi:cytochrome c oxidase assembly protein subunit 15
MAVKGWIDAEGHFMPLFPIAMWFRDPGTFVEHTHRMIGIVVGLLAIATVVATHLKDERKTARVAAWAALLAICLQGAVGGTRVLENSQDWAFLHGALGQLVLAVVWCATLVLMPSFKVAPRVAPAVGKRLWMAARVSVFIVYAQIVLGTWFRHSVRVSTEIEGSDQLPFPVGVFILHAMGAIFVLVTVLITAKRARQGWEESDDPVAARLFRRLEVWLHTAFGLQFTLGIGALSTLKMERTAVVAVLISTLHVLFGALTLAACASAVLWGLRFMWAKENAGDAPGDMIGEGPTA